MRLIPLFCTSIAVVLPFQVLAQSPENEKYIGVGARVRPAYQGAASNRVDAIPYLRLYGEHFFGRTTQGMLEGGWRTRPFGGWVLGAQAVYEEGRISDESAFLEEHHFADLDVSASLGVHAEGDWKIGPVPLNALLRYRHNVESNNGSQADVRLTAGILEWKMLRAGLYGQLTWADGNANQSYFGVSSQQSARSGLPAYSAGAGLRYVQLGLLGDVSFSRHWIGLWGASVHLLQGDARDSPIVQDKTNWLVNAGVAYRF
jgi:outer membrane protein